MIVAALLLVALISQVAYSHRASVGAMPDLKAAVPQTLLGWTVSDLSLGLTEAASRSVAESLDFDAYAYREYSRNGRAFAVYVAYWAPKGVPPHQTIGHNPDWCWPLNGFTTRESRDDTPLVAGPATLEHGHWRQFATPGGGPVYVEYWSYANGHIVNGRAESLTAQQLITWWRGALHFVIGRPEAMMLVRISSSEPLEDFANEPAFQTVVADLTKLVESQQR